MQIRSNFHFKTTAKALCNLCLATCALSAAASAQANPSNYVILNAPNSQYTIPDCINPAGSVTGYYADADFVTHGFVVPAGGTLTTVDPPGSLHTVASGINAAGAIVGYFQSGSQSHGFLRSPSGAFTVFDPAGSADTLAQAINNRGVISGTYVDANDVFHGFIRSADGTITSYDAPGAGTIPGTGTGIGYFLYEGSGCSTLNNAGVATGSFTDQSNKVHGYVRAADGTVSTFDASSASYGTSPTGVSAAGTVVGSYFETDFSAHSFERSATGTITTYDPSNATTSSIASETAGVSANGIVVGAASLTESVQAVAFVQSALGTAQFISVPGSSYTYGTAVNPGGTVVGYFHSGDSQQGFLAYPPY